METTPESLLIDQLRQMYQAERQLSKQLPKLIKAARSPQVKAALQKRLAESGEYLVRLEVAFDTLDRSTESGLLGGFRRRTDENPDKQRLESLAVDAAVMADAQCAQHHHIATYRTLTAWASALGHDHVARLLAATLEQEVATEAAISTLAEAGLREMARPVHAPRPARAESAAPPWTIEHESRLIPGHALSATGK